MLNPVEQRRVRFASIVGIDRSDLPLAAEVWQSDLNGRTWVDRNTLKLASLFTQYMADPDPKCLTLNYLDRTFQMDTTAVRDALRQMKMYGVVEAFNVMDGKVRVSLHLSLTQRLQVLEMRNRLLDLSAFSSMRELQVAQECDLWDLPPEEPDAEALEEHDLATSADAA